MHSCIDREYCQISALSTDLLSVEIFVSCNFIPYFLLILHSILTLWNNSSLWNPQTCVRIYTADRADKLYGSLLISTDRTVSLLFSICLSALAVADLPPGSLSCLQGKTSNMFLLCGAKYPWEIGYYQNIFDRNFVPINVKCFSWHMSCHLLQALLVNDHKWVFRPICLPVM